MPCPPRRALAPLALLLGCCLPGSVHAQPVLAHAQPPGQPEPRRARRAAVFITERGGPKLRVARRVPTGVLPKSVHISPDGRRLVVCNFGRPDRDNVFVYDALTLERVGAVSFVGNAVEAAFSPDGRTLYVSNFREHQVEVIDFESLAVEAEIAVGHHPKTMALSADGRTLYVANWASNTVGVVDTRERRMVRELRTARHPRGLAVLRDGTLLAAAFHGDVIHVFPPGAAKESERWAMCRYPRHIVLGPRSAAQSPQTIYVTCSLGRVGFYVPEAKGRPFGLGPTGRNPRTIAIDADGRYIGVANYTSRDVSLIDTVARTHRRHRIPDAGRIVGLAMHPGPALRLYATSWDTGELLMLTERGRPPPGERDARAAAQPALK